MKNIIANNTIMNNVYKYFCAVLLVIGTSASAWATDCVYYVYNGSSYVEYVTLDQSKTVPQGPYSSDTWGVPYCWANTTNLSAIATAMAKPTDYDVVRFYPNNPESDQLKNLGTDQTALYAVYGTYGNWSVTAVPDYLSDYHTITMAVSPAGKGTATIEGASSLKVAEYYDEPEIYAVPISGWMFKEWTTNKPGNTVFDDAESDVTTVAVDADVTITAVFEQPATITFNKNGGSGTMADQYVIKGRETALNSNTYTAPKGKFFGGWSTSNDGIAIYKDGGNITTSTDITLYAIWVDGTKAAVIYELEGLTHDGSNPKTLNATATLYASFNLLSGYSTPVSGYVKVSDWYTYTLGVSDQISYLAGDLTCTADGIISAGDVVLVHLEATELTCTVPTIAFANAGPIGKATTASNFTNAASATYSESSTGQTITYSSSNTDVATVSNESGHEGEVDPVAAGIVTITATAVENSTYCEVSTSYTLYVGTAPTVNDNNYATSVTSTSISFKGGQVSNKGGTDIVKYGWVVGTSSGPTVESNVTWAGFEADISLDTDFGIATTKDALTAGTKYYFRPFATNQAGQTGYGTEHNFSLPYYITLDKNNSDPGSADGYAYIRPNRTSWATATAPTRSGYHVVGYYTTSGLTTEVADDEGNLNASITVDATNWTDGDKKWVKAGGATFYAKWESNNKTLAIADLDHVTLSSSTPSIAAGSSDEVTTGSTVTLAYEDVDDDYLWGGWHVYKTGDESTTVSVNGSNQFTMPDYNVTVSAYLYTDLRAQCEEITLVTEDGDPILITARGNSEVTYQTNIFGTKKLLLTTANMPDDEEVTITGTNLHFYTKDGTTRYEAIDLETPLTEEEIYVSYLPTSAGDGSITSPTITVTVGSTVATQDFDGLVKVRNLPEKVIIAVKTNDTWIALPPPASSSNPDGVAVSVIDGAATGPDSLALRLWSVKTTDNSYDRSGTATSATPAAMYGDRLRFGAYGRDNKALWANNVAENKGTDISTANAISGKGSDGAAPNEWIVETREVNGEFVYKLKATQPNNDKYLRYWLAANGGPKWGTYASGEQDLYILPYTEKTPTTIKVMEWGTNRLAVSYPNKANCSAMTAKIGSNDATTVTISSIGGDIYTLTNVGNLQSNPAQTLTLAVTESGDAKEVTFQIPFIITSSAGVTEAAIRSEIGDNAAKVTDVVVRSSGKLTTGTASGAFKDLYVYPGGKADISQAIKFKNVYLRGGFSWLGGDYAHPQLHVAEGTAITNIGTSNINVYYDLYLKDDIYYMTALPKTVAISAITNEDNDTEDWTAWVRQYSGQGRTQSPKVSGWSNISGDSFVRGAGYEIAIAPRSAGAMNGRTLGILRFPLIANSAWSDEADLEPTVKGWGANNAAVSDNNKGWNLIGNPFMTAYENTETPGSDPSGLMQTKTLVPHGDPWDGTYDWSTDDVKYFTIPLYTEYEYTDVRAYPYKLDAFFPFFIQVKGDGTLSFDGDNRALKAPARFMSEPQREVIVDFSLTNAAKKKDVAGLTICNKYSADFDMNDKEKTIQNGTATMKVYTIVSEYRTAFNSLPEAAAAQPIPVGYIAPQAGTYTFALEKGNYGQVEHVWLTDYVENSRVDLLGGAKYAFQTTAGAINDRFAINVILTSKQETPTGVDEAETEYKRPVKFMYQQKIYILRGNVIYDMTGKRVKEINK